MDSEDFEIEGELPIPLSGLLYSVNNATYNVKWSLAQDVIEIVQETESPIEAMMVCGLISQVGSYGFDIALFVDGKSRRQHILSSELPVDYKGRSVVGLQVQKHIGQYRADVVVSLAENVGPFLNPVMHIVRCVVECDGHDFHEKTKTQASRDKKRDRDIQKLGYRILRFSGSDIHRDMNDCADSVYQQLVSDMRAWESEHRSAQAVTNK